MLIPHPQIMQLQTSHPPDQTALLTARVLHLQETVEAAAEFNCDLARRAAAEEVLQPEVDVPVHRQLPSPLPAIVQACMGPAAFHAADGEAWEPLLLASECAGELAGLYQFWCCRCALEQTERQCSPTDVAVKSRCTRLLPACSGHVAVLQ